MKKKLRKANAVKLSPVQRLKSMMAARRKSATEISELRRMLADKSARLMELETSGNLNEATVINEIGRLQVLVKLLPRRIAFKEGEDVKAGRNLVEATNEFIREHLGPRVRQLGVRTRVIVEKELSSHFRDAAELIRAVAGSERVRSIALLDWPASVQPEHGAMLHAEGALEAWAAADEFEKALLADECMTASLMKS